jgi:hypothetical protein
LRRNFFYFALLFCFNHSWLPVDCHIDLVWTWVIRYCTQVSSVAEWMWQNHS